MRKSDEGNPHLPRGGNREGPEDQLRGGTAQLSFRRRVEKKV